MYYVRSRHQSVAKETKENKQSLNSGMLDSQVSLVVNRPQGLEEKKKEHSRT